MSVLNFMVSDVLSESDAFTSFRKLATSPQSMLSRMVGKRSADADDVKSACHIQQELLVVFESLLKHLLYGTAMLLSPVPDHKARIDLAKHHDHSVRRGCFQCRHILRHCLGYGVLDFFNPETVAPPTDVTSNEYSGNRIFICSELKTKAWESPSTSTVFII